MKIFISINTSWNVFNFRAGLLRALISEGHQVVVLAPEDDYSNRLIKLGCKFVPLPIDNKGINPFRDLVLFYRYIKIFLKDKPDLYLGYTVKPNIYGSIAGLLLGIRVVNNISGLGTAYISNNWLTKLVSTFYKIAFSKSQHVFFQNHDDMNLFISLGLIKPIQASRLPGSGINLNYFSYSPVKVKEGVPFTFLLVARLLWDKGVGEYVNAARIIKKNNSNVNFQILGFLDVQNRTAVPTTQVTDWVNDGLIEYLGAHDDVRSFLIGADCVVLPSYREGVPKSLLEAASVGRPIITTDVVGCREAIDDNVSGFLCEVRNAEDLAHKMQKMISLSFSERNEMGLAGRKKVEKEFDESIVINKYLEVISCLKKVV